MASSSSSDPPSQATKQSNFEQAIALSLHLWPALTLAVENHWGGPASDDKRSWFAGAVADLFPPISDGAGAGAAPKKPSPASASADDAAQEEPDVEYVEEFLLQVMMDEFEVNIDDDSSFEVAEQIVKLRGQCLKGQFGGVEDLQTRWQSRKGAKVGGLFKKADDADQDTDWSDESGDDDGEDDGEGDVQMDEAPPLVSVPKEKPAPEVDEDGFTKVTKKKR